MSELRILTLIMNEADINNKIENFQGYDNIHGYDKFHTPFLSIAIASYNYGKYLDRAFEAILRQDFKDFEIVYLDDASSDDSVDIIRRIIKEHPDMSIRLIQNSENMGIFESKTRLIRECAGQFIMLCDADDWMADGCLEALVQAVKTEGTDRAVCEVVDIDDTGKQLQIQDLPPEPSRWLWNINHGCIYRRSIIIENDIKIQLEPDDVNFITEFNRFSDKVSWIHRPLYYWYVHSDSSGRNISEHDRDETLSRFEEMMSYLGEICDSINSEQDRKELKLLAMKLYYLYLFHTMKGYSCKEKCRGYRSVSRIMNTYFPGYLNSGALNGMDRKLRSYAYNIIRYSVLLERLKLFLPAYMGYHLVSKVHYFDQ